MATVVVTAFGSIADPNRCALSPASTRSPPGVQVGCRAVSAHSRRDDSGDATAPETEDFALVVSTIPRRCVTLAEVTLLTAATAVGFVALVSLAAAHLHQHSLPNVAIGSVCLWVCSPWWCSGSTALLAHGCGEGLVVDSLPGGVSPGADWAARHRNAHESRASARTGALTLGTRRGRVATRSSWPPRSPGPADDPVTGWTAWHRDTLRPSCRACAGRSGCRCPAGRSSRLGSAGWVRRRGASTWCMRRRCCSPRADGFR